jgi:hypothetical protein
LPARRHAAERPIGQSLMVTPTGLEPVFSP